MKNYLFKILLVIILWSSLEAQSLNYFDITDLSKIKKEYLKNGSFKEEINTLILISEQYKNIPFTITKYNSPKGELGLHDYFSDSPYWWPVPGDSTAPYIRHDGIRNPNRFMSHKEELQKFYKTITSLAFAFYFTDNKEYAIKASMLLNAWFVDKATKMNPNLKYAQMIQNRTKKRGVGVLDGRRFALMIESINLLRLAGAIDNTLYYNIKEWYSEFYTWLTESYYGLDERQRGNNHSTWYAVQVTTISDFLQKDDMIKEMDDYTKHFLLDNQFDKNAHQPLEEARTKSLSYSIFNVTAYSYLNAVFIKHDIDNWNYKNKNGVTLIDAINLLVPFLKTPTDWKLKQITEYNNRHPLFLAITGLKLNNKEYLNTYNKYSKYDKKEVMQQYFEPMQIVFGLVTKKKIEKNEN